MINPHDEQYVYSISMRAITGTSKKIQQARAVENSYSWWATPNYFLGIICHSVAVAKQINCFVSSKITAVARSLLYRGDTVQTNKLKTQTFKYFSNR